MICYLNIKFTSFDEPVLQKLNYKTKNFVAFLLSQDQGVRIGSLMSQMDGIK